MRTFCSILALVLVLGGDVRPSAGNVQWKPFSPRNGGFSVQIPGSPHETKRTVETSVGSVDVISYVLDLASGEKSLVVGYSELPSAAIKPGTEQKRLDNARDGAVTSAKGKLRDEKRIALDKHPGREFFVGVNEKMEVRTRIYAVKNRLYQLLVVGPPDWLVSSEVEKFLDSFKLTR